MENREMMMECSLDESLQYIVFLTRHIPEEDISSFILVVLLELRFQSHLDGFVYLRDSYFIYVVY